jgi:hypothetical protein
MEVCPEAELIAFEDPATVCDRAFQIGQGREAQMIGHMRHGSPPRLMVLQSILSPNRGESLPTPSAGVRITPSGPPASPPTSRTAGRLNQKRPDAGGRYHDSVDQSARSDGMRDLGDITVNLFLSLRLGLESCDLLLKPRYCLVDR